MSSSVVRLQALVVTGCLPGFRWVLESCANFVAVNVQCLGACFVPSTDQQENPLDCPMYWVFPCVAVAGLRDPKAGLDGYLAVFSMAPMRLQMVAGIP